MVHMQPTTALYFQMEMHVLIILIEILNEDYISYHPSLAQNIRTFKLLRSALIARNKRHPTSIVFHGQFKKFMSNALVTMFAKRTMQLLHTIGQGNIILF